MTMMEWTVIIGGLTAIAWVNWYFFLAQTVSEKQARKNAGRHTKTTR